MRKGDRMLRWWILAGVAALAAVALLVPHRGPSPEGLPLAQLEAELIPAVGTETAYGVPLSWDNAQRFADWFYQIRLSPDEAEVLQRALAPVPTPCCDDTRLTRCCCERSGQICNLVRSARGLAAWLIQRQGFAAEEVRAAVEEWIRFAHRDYYLARALRDRGLSPAEYGLTTQGACYFQVCELPMRQGGCGGMGPQVRI